MESGTAKVYCSNAVPLRRSLVQQVFFGADPGAVRPAGVIPYPHRGAGIGGGGAQALRSAALAHVGLGHMALADLGARKVDPGVAGVALDHGPAGERLHAETRHQVPRVVIWETDTGQIVFTLFATGYEIIHSMKQKKQVWRIETACGGRSGSSSSKTNCCDSKAVILLMRTRKMCKECISLCYFIMYDKLGVEV